MCMCAGADRPLIYFVQQPPSDVIGHVGGSVYINCSARSQSDVGQVKVTWLKDGQDAIAGNPEDGGGRRSVMDCGTLVIAPVVMSHESRSAMSHHRRWRSRGMDHPVRRRIGHAESSWSGDEGVYVCVATYGSASIISRPATLRVASMCHTLFANMISYLSPPLFKILSAGQLSII